MISDSYGVVVRGVLASVEVKDFDIPGENGRSGFQRTGCDVTLVAPPDVQQLAMSGAAVGPPLLVQAEQEDGYTARDLLRYAGQLVEFSVENKPRSGGKAFRAVPDGLRLLSGARPAVLDGADLDDAVADAHGR